MSDAEQILGAVDGYLTSDVAGMSPGEARYHTLGILAALRTEGFAIVRADSWRLRSDFQVLPLSK